MNIRRTLLITLLLAGTVAGYGSGIYRLAHRHDRAHDRHGCDRWERWERSHEPCPGEGANEAAAATR
jgi:hypothetical protein